MLNRVSPEGLSPRIRGNRPHYRHRHNYQGSIPAHTGKPSFSFSSSSRYWVYPRAYGETYCAGRSTRRVRGLSPRIRGNRSRGQHRIARIRSIPAHTGKPDVGVGIVGLLRVYPRAYGETMQGRLAGNVQPGLSPRIRGNLQPNIKVHVFSGSIPAHTGKPLAGEGGFARQRVYPRAYGETGLGTTAPMCASGLSPRIRGNRAPKPIFLACLRSIPAHTGKPRLHRIEHARNGVYPRAYGETEDIRARPTLNRGLSPRIRGNHVQQESRVFLGGSIPAHTGKPLLIRY